jgi:hypothetical protein
MKSQFGRDLSALHYYALSIFLITNAQFERRLVTFFFLTLLAPFPKPQGIRVLKFTTYVCLVPNMLQTKFEKNWDSGNYPDVKNVQVLKDNYEQD